MSDIASSNEHISELSSSNESLNDSAASTSSSTHVCSNVKPSPTLTTITDEHAIPLHKLCELLSTKLDTGLSRKEAKKLLKNNGDNSFDTPACKVTSSLIGKLSPSTCRKKFTRSEWDRLVAHRIPTEVNVLRNGTRMRIFGKNLVVGDIVILCRNDIVPADIRLIDSKDVFVDNRLITGQEVEARSHEISTPDCLLSPNMVFSCTRVLQGKCAGIVLRTGEDTVFGSLKNYAQRVRFAAVR